jgi:hypothetical protein
MENGLQWQVKILKIKNTLKERKRKMGKRKSKLKKVEVRKGSRLKLKDGKFAKAEESLKANHTTILVKVYGCREVDSDAVINIPVGQIAEVVRV